MRYASKHIAKAKEKTQLLVKRNTETAGIKALTTNVLVYIVLCNDIISYVERQAPQIKKKYVLKRKLL
jgi:hypothetical protein